MNGFETYQDTAVTTQSKGRLVVMLYDGAVKFMKMAIKEIMAIQYFWETEVTISSPRDPPIIFPAS